MERFIIKQHETAVYEIFADSKEDAERRFIEEADGDFIGYEESNDFIVTVEKEDEYGRISEARR